MSYVQSYNGFAADLDYATLEKGQAAPHANQIPSLVLGSLAPRPAPQGARSGQG